MKVQTIIQRNLFDRLYINQKFKVKRTAIITGAANGMGRRVATAYATEGFSVVKADIDSNRGTVLHYQLIKKKLTGMLADTGENSEALKLCIRRIQPKAFA